jgi:hypothetical protein
VVDAARQYTGTWSDVGNDPDLAHALAKLERIRWSPEEMAALRAVAEAAKNAERICTYIPQTFQNVLPMLRRALADLERVTK